MIVPRMAVVSVIFTLIVPYQAIAQSLALQSRPPLTEPRSDDEEDDPGPFRYKSKLFWTGMTLVSAGGVTGLVWFDQKYPFDGQPPASPRKRAATFRTAGSLMISGLVCLIVYEARRERETRRRATRSVVE